jgi:hypothetical protein
VRVSIESELYGGVTSEVLDVLRVRAAREQDREAAMPQIVPAYIRQTSLPEQGFEVSVDYVLRVEGSTLAGSEYEP